MTMSIDDSEVRGLAQILVEAAGRSRSEVRKVVARGALNIKRDAQNATKGLAHAPAYPRAISYDTKELAQTISAEIGPDKEKRQGALGSLIEFGSVNNPPRPHMIPAGEREQPKFEKALDDLARTALESR